MTEDSSTAETFSFNDCVYQVVRAIPRGMVASYGQVARLAGVPRAARAVGWALHKNPLPGIIPCHRVVFKDGHLSESFAFGGSDVQRRLLSDEGVCFTENGLVDMKIYQWNR